MKKRALSLLLACFMVVSTFIISRPVVDVHAVEYYEDVNQWTLPMDWNTGNKAESTSGALFTTDRGWDYAERADEPWKFAFYTDVDAGTAYTASSSTTAANASNTGGIGPAPYIESRHNRWLTVDRANASSSWTSWYIGSTGRWRDTSIAYGDNETYMRLSHKNASYTPAVVFIAPLDGTYSFSELVTGTLFSYTSGSTTYTINSLATVRKNGEVIASFTPTESTPSTTLTGTVELMKGEELAFVFEQADDSFCTALPDANGATYQFKLGETVVKRTGDLTTYPTYELPMEWLNSTDIDDNGWSTSRQGEWFLTHSGNLNGTPSSSLRSAWTTGSAPTTVPKPWFEGGKNVTRNNWYINPNYRWNGTTIFNSGVEGEYFLAIPSASYNPSIVFTAPSNGEYEFSALFNGADYEGAGNGMVDANGVAIEVLATATANGKVLDSFTVKDGSLDGSLEGSVVLRAGQQLVFTFDLTTAATIADHDDFLHITGATVKKVGAVPADYTADTELPIIFDKNVAYTHTDKFGMLELHGYRTDVGIYDDTIKFEVLDDGTFIVWDTDIRRPTSGDWTAVWNGTVDGKLTGIGGHYSNSTVQRIEGSAFEFTAPYNGDFKITVACTNGWFTARLSYSKYMLKDADGNILDEITNEDATSSDRLVPRTVEATVTLAKGEKVYFIRETIDDPDNASINLSCEGDITLSIIGINHNCSADTVTYHPAASASCADGNIEHWACPCGTNYADADATVELVGATVIPGTGHVASDEFESNATQHWNLCAGGCGLVMDKGAHTWGYDGKCSVCGYACKHETDGGVISTPNCIFPGTCSICGDAVKPTDSSVHVLGDSEVAYYSNGNGTHKKVTVCCKAELAETEKCVFGDDDVCDKCGYESASNSTVEDAFDNVFNGGSNDVTVTGPTTTLPEYVTKTEGTAVEGIEYAQFNIHHLADGTIKLRHHFIINPGISCEISVNGDSVLLANVTGTNIYYFDTTPVLGKYGDADKIAVNGTVTYSVSLYSYIRKALASSELNDNQKNYLKALYDANEEAKNAEVTTSVYVGMANQRTEMGVSGRSGAYIDIYDISTGNMNTLVNSYKAPTSAISGFKFRNSAEYGEVVLITGGYDGAIVSMETGETIWMTSKAAQNSHSIELLPNGVLATASSAGSAVHLFNTALSEDQEPTILALDDAHGVLWDPEYNVLWALGRTHLWALNVTLNEDGTVSVAKNEALSVEMPMDHGHDLQSFYGNKDYLLVTGETVMLYNKVTKTFTELYYEGHSVKGIGVLPNGDIVYIYPDDLYETWNSTWINVIDSATGEITQIHSNQGRFYKLRVLNYDYQ
ncbi:MAG: WD40 repeat domain-containing protein [Clostridia bacterium]|nr:WD40 repeat domain-containing protein [Clostridia bacterium]